MKQYVTAEIMIRIFDCSARDILTASLNAGDEGNFDDPSTKKFNIGGNFWTK